VIKAEFSAASLQSSVSHDPSEISNMMIWCKTFIVIINVENSCEGQLATFSGFFDENKNSKAF